MKASPEFRDDQSFPKLAGASKELTEIAKVYEKTFGRKPRPELRGRDATEQAFRSRVLGQDYIHLATHGFFAPASLRSALAPQDDPLPPAVGDRFATARRLTFTHPGLLSGIALAGANRSSARDRTDGESLDDGILTATEVAEIDLTRARLVVLSACETGLGDTAGGEGLLGLQRALHVAGARSAVTSLWQVPDDATRALMVEFYSNLWEGNADVLTALGKAQRTIMLTYDPKSRLIVRGPGGERPRLPGKDGKRLSPFYWAGFVLSGDWQ